MESPNVEREKDRKELKERFHIEKLEKRIAPKNLVHANVHVGGGNNVHIKV
jgi:hypothetical protein